VLHSYVHNGGLLENSAISSVITCIGSQKFFPRRAGGNIFAFPREIQAALCVPLFKDTIHTNIENTFDCDRRVRFPVDDIIAAETKGRRNRLKKPDDSGEEFLIARTHLCSLQELRLPEFKCEIKMHIVDGRQGTGCTIPFNVPASARLGRDTLTFFRVQSSESDASTQSA
jgi:hypothetical protein